VSLDRSSTGDSTLVATIAERFDAALATGRYDRLFAK
jgi:nicotinamide riboside kinase